MGAGDFRPDLADRLRPPREAPIPCKVCGAAATPMGAVDFNRTCEDIRGLRLPRTGVPVAYHRCGGCGLIFTETFDDWTQADFEAHVYNDGYAEADPDYLDKRPQAMALSVVGAFRAQSAALDILDYGGGNGRFAEILRGAGFRCETYDPFNPAFAARPQRRFDLITCFETLEHMPDPIAGAKDIEALLAPVGAIVFATLTQPADIEQIGLGWWYVGPRNGHVTLHSRTSLGHLWGRHGLRVGHFNDHTHVAVRQPAPGWIRHLTGG